MPELFKVLVDGQACHGGDMAWSLPTDNGGGIADHIHRCEHYS